MHIGMLWFDDSNVALSTKIEKAAKYYEKKYGCKPDLCLVHPKMLTDKMDIDGMTVRPYRPVLPGHIWIGIEDKE